MKRGFIQIPILIAIIIGTALVGSGGYFVAKEISKSPSPVVQDEPEQINLKAETVVKTEVQETDVKSQDTPTKNEMQSTSATQTTPKKQEARSEQNTASPQEEIAKAVALSATCSPQTSTVTSDDKVIFTAVASGGKPPYKFSWSGTAISGIETQSVTTQYPARPFSRSENAFVTITSSDGQRVTANCKITIQAKQETSTSEETSPAQTYSDSACSAQKQGYLSEVDTAYLTWYDQWQAARAELSSCYDSNPVPYCDNKMTDVNVEWQAKISATMKSYQDKLTQCAPDKRIFNDISDVVSSPY